MESQVKSSMNIANKLGGPSTFKIHFSPSLKGQYVEWQVKSLMNIAKQTGRGGRIMGNSLRVMIYIEGPMS